MLGRCNVTQLSRSRISTGMLTALALGVAASLALTGCSSNEQLAEQYQNSSDKGYISGDGSIESIAIEERGEPVTYSGMATDGEAREYGEYLGDVVVINFWYAGCPPCRAEAPDLVTVANEYADQGVRFLGVNTRDNLAQALMFEEEFSIPYPSILDKENEAAVQRAFAGSVPLNTVPTTLILDRQGRVAHRILGQIGDASMLETMVKETLAEDN
jgi:thiol-disulfide isomerase/thioredoxin